MKKTTVTHYEINIKRPGAGEGSIRAAFVTDLHNASWAGDEDALPDIIGDQKPDIILCGGDMIVAHPGVSVAPAVYFMERMADIAPVYMGFGNHEYRSRLYREQYGSMYTDFFTPILKCGVNVLYNSSKSLTLNGVKLFISGLEIPRRYYGRFRKLTYTAEQIEHKLGKLPEAEASVLLAHNPKYRAAYYDWGADLTLCGHYHGGVMGLTEHTGLISPDLHPFDGACHGHFLKNGRSLIVSAGLGEHTIPFRINNPRELVIVDMAVNV